MSDLSKLCDKIKSQYPQVMETIVSYSGGGDEGSIETIQVIGLQGLNLYLSYRNDLWNAIADWFYEAFETTGYDYANNEGGVGNMTIYPCNTNAILRHSDYVQETQPQPEVDFV
jgi:hypothetical protein